MSYTQSQADNIEELLNRAKLITKTNKRPTTSTQKPKSYQSDLFLTDCYLKEK